MCTHHRSPARRPRLLPCRSTQGICLVAPDKDDPVNDRRRADCPAMRGLCQAVLQSRHLAPKGCFDRMARRDRQPTAGDSRRGGEVPRIPGRPSAGRMRDSPASLRMYTSFPPPPEKAKRCRRPLGGPGQVSRLLGGSRRFSNRLTPCGRGVPVHRPVRLDDEQRLPSVRRCPVSRTSWSPGRLRPES